MVSLFVPTTVHVFAATSHEVHGAGQLPPSSFMVLPTTQ
jgi:hypothetical protein